MKDIYKVESFNVIRSVNFRQENPKHKVHTMTVAPFIVDTGMVKASKIRFPGIFILYPSVILLN